MRITAITPMKNEGPFILEWVVYHRLIGFNDIILFTNDCTDGTDEIAERLDEMGIVRHYPNPSFLTRGKGGHHWAVIKYINAMLRPRRSDWYANFDIDEFWCIHPGAGRLEDLFNTVPEAQVISACQYDFGTGGIDRFDPTKLQMEQFTRAIHRSNAALGAERRRGVKSLVRQDAPITEIANHVPLVAPDAELTHVNGDGREIPPEFLREARKSLVGEEIGYDLVQLNHYALRAAENFLVKVERGNANHHVENKELVQHWTRYFRKYEHNQVEDTAMHRHVPAVREGIAELLEDPELEALHDATVAWHLDAASQLMSKRPYPHLMKRINQIRAEQDAQTFG